MAKIENLTPEQEARLPEFREKWTNIGLCTDPANRPAAEEGVRRAYKDAGLKVPGRIVWAGSPMSMAISRAINLILNDLVTDALSSPTKLKAALAGRAKLTEPIAPGATEEVLLAASETCLGLLLPKCYTTLRKHPGDEAKVFCRLWQRLLVKSKRQDKFKESIRSAVTVACHGQHDAHWVGFYDYFREVLNLVEDTEKLVGVTQVSKNAGWFIPHENICWLSERHTTLHRDGEGRVHSVDGPCIAYPDGWKIYAVHGVRVQADWIEKKDELAPETALTWENIEERRAAAEILGWDKVISKLNPKVINEDPDPEIGTLIEVDIPDSGRERFLRVQCGTGRRFALPVPPNMQTALEANAWTYNLAPEDYMPEVRT